MNYKHQNLAALFLVFSMYLSVAQQDAQFTNYMFNTMAVNSAYAGSRGNLTVVGLHRSQWVGLDGAPQTQSFSVDAPVGKRVGLGVSLVNDRIGPSDTFLADANFSYTINITDTRLLSFGVKGGGRMLNLDWSKVKTKTADANFQQSIRSRFLPTAGIGLYLHDKKSYLGLSVPNFVTSERYNELQDTFAAERLHLYLIGGYVFDLNASTKMMPAFLFKHVVGAPVIVDISANVMFNNNVRLGVAYRWDDSVNALLGIQIHPKIMLGYAFDYTLTELRKYSKGSHEVMLRFELKTKEKQLKSPRFF